jgi:ubiquinone/menaquinone biosynthesis C-methylase UbiE
MSDAREQKRLTSDVFNAVATEYDAAALRFFPSTAAAMVELLQPQPDWQVLDVATGTGALAVALARAVHQGSVQGIDLSAAMLAQAEKKIQQQSLQNIELLQMDAEQPEFNSDSFHALTCSFGLFFIPDMEEALRQWQRVTRPGGTVLFSSFTETAFQRLGEYFVEDLKQAGVDVDSKPLASARLQNADTCRDLMAASGFANIKQVEVQNGYHLKDEQEWWDAVWGTALRGLVLQLPEQERDAFKRRHLQRIAELRTDDGLWMDVGVRLTSGQVPA